MDPVGDGRSVKVRCHRRGGHPHHRVEPEGRQGKGRSQARGDGERGGRGISAGGNSGEDNGDVNGGRRGRGQVRSLGDR